MRERALRSGVSHCLRQCPSICFANVLRILALASPIPFHSLPQCSSDSIFNFIYILCRTRSSGVSVEAGKYKYGGEQKSCELLGSQGLPLHSQQCRDATGSVRSVRGERRVPGAWMGTEIGKLGGYSFQGVVTAGDGSNQKGDKMGAGFINLRRKKR